MDWDSILQGIGGNVGSIVGNLLGGGSQTPIMQIPSNPAPMTGIIGKTGTTGGNPPALQKPAQVTEYPWLPLLFGQSCDGEGSIEHLLILLFCALIIIIGLVSLIMPDEQQAETIGKVVEVAAA